MIGGRHASHGTHPKIHAGHPRWAPDTVLDPFAGSNTTGSVAERLGRNWISIELSREYAEDSRLRFGSEEFGMSACDQPALQMFE